MNALRLWFFAAAGLAAAACTAAAQDAGAAAPRRVETPNGALSFEIPAGWGAKALGNGLALEPPAPAGHRQPFDETIVVACELFQLKSLDDAAKVDDLLSRLRAGQLATIDLERRAPHERIMVGDRFGLVVAYSGTDDSGMPAVLRIAILPDGEGRVGLITARMPAKRLEQRRLALDRALTTMKFAPAADARSLAKRLVGSWRSEAAPGITIEFKANGTFEESRSGRTSDAATQAPKITRAGSFEVIGREVRLRFDEGETRSFRIDSEPEPGTTFVSANQAWKRQ